MEPPEKVADVTLEWSLNLEEALQVLKRWRQLRQLTFEGNDVPQFKALTDFILEMENLSDFHIVHRMSYDHSLKKYYHTNYDLACIFQSCSNLSELIVS